jgi:hypothetical protein
MMKMPSEVWVRLITKTFSLETLCSQESISISKEVVAANNVVIVPDRVWGKDRLNSDFIPLLKDMRLRVRTSYIATRDPAGLGYYDFRGGEYELPLFIVKDLVLPIVLGLVANRIDKMLSDHQDSKRKDPKNVKLHEPVVKARWYITESEEYFELEGPAAEASRAISTYLGHRRKQSR